MRSMGSYHIYAIAGMVPPFFANRNRAGMPGYDLKVNGEYARLESLWCSSCSLILRDAIQTEEGLRFCDSCWAELGSLKAKELGVDPTDSTHPDKAVRREINKLPVLCENYENGCKWTGTLQEHEGEHKAICEHKTQKCSLGCGLRLPLERLRRHEREECLFRKVKCSHCGTTTLAKDFDSHLLNCPNAPYSCEYCLVQMPKKDMDHHLLLSCKEQLQCYSCDEQIHRNTAKQPNVASHLKDHEKLFFHHQKIGMNIKTLHMHYQEELKYLREELEQNQEQNLTLNQKLTEANASIKKLEEKLESEPSNRVLMEMQEKLRQLDEKIDKVDKLAQRGGGGSSYYPSNQGYDEPQTGDGRMGQIDTRIAEQERTAGMLKVHLSELELQLQASLASTYNGSFLWRIPDVRRRKRDAIDGKITSIYSPPFYTGRNGYKMCIRAYLNGDGIGYNTHVSIFFVLMKGEYDPLLKWPFDYKVSLIMVDQDHKRHIVQTFKPSPSSSSFQRPKSDMNIASGCPKFAELKILDNESYVKEDVMYIKAIVDTTRIFHP